MTPGFSSIGLPHWLKGGVFWMVASYSLGLGLLNIQPALAGDTTEVDGVTYVKNGPLPELGKQTLNLEELWRAGGDDEDVLLGTILGVSVGGDGNLYLLDAQLCQVHVFDAEGNYLKSLSRQGEGPGEFQRAESILFMPDSTIGVVEYFPGKVVRFDRDGVPAGTFIPGGDDPTTGGFRSLRDLEYRGGILVGCGANMSDAGGSLKRTQYLSRFSTAGAEQTRYLEKISTPHFARAEFNEKEEYFIDRGAWAVGPDGGIYAAPERDDYRIYRYSPDGSLEQIIDRDYDPRKRTQAEKDQVLEGIVMIVNGERITPDAKIEDHDACVSQIEVLDDGSIWVLNGHGIHEQPEGILRTYDVFDSEGHFKRQVAVACEGDSRDDGLFFVGNDRVLLVRGMRSSRLGMFGGSNGDDESGSADTAQMEVIYYRLPWPL